MNKAKRNGILGSIVFHVLALLALLLIALRTPLPLPGEEGVQVDLGYSDQGMGNDQKEESAYKSPPKQQQAPPEPVEEENIISEDNLDTPVLEEKKEEEKKPEEKKEEIVKKDKEVEEPVEEEVEKEPEPVVNPNALYKGKSKNATESGSEGITGQAGDQGKPGGDKGVKQYEGLGGLGNGISFSLGGRGAKRLPKPDYNSDDQGKVVVEIYVDRDGNVKRAIAGAKGTTVSDMSLRNMARDAAMRAKFTPNPNAPELQKGTITYNFIKLN